VSLNESYKRERDDYFSIINNIKYQSPRYIHERCAVNPTDNIFVSPKLEYIK